MAFVLDTFMNEIKKVNSTFERVKESSLHSLIQALEALKGAPTAPQKTAIQNALAFVPTDKQKKYKAALDYMKKELGAFHDGVPTDPVMKFKSFSIINGAYVGKNTSGATKPIELVATKKDSPGPRSFVHTHEISWKSSNGDPNALKTVRTREHVKFRADTQAAPFNAIADPDREFYHPGEQGSVGATSNMDDHSIKLPALIVRNPRQAGTLIGEQWYQYSLDDGKTWQNIDGAAYLLEKTVKKDGNDWVMVFKKSNWPEHNKKKFHFEVHYTIGPAPEYLPAKDTDVQKMGFPEAADMKKFARKVVATG